MKQNNDVSLIYFASTGPYVMSREVTNLPTKDWSMTIITEHNTNNISMAITDFQNSKEFEKLKKEFAIECIYNICFKMNDERI